MASKTQWVGRNDQLTRGLTLRECDPCHGTASSPAPRTHDDGMFRGCVRSGDFWRALLGSVVIEALRHQLESHSQTSRLQWQYSVQYAVATDNGPSGSGLMKYCPSSQLPEDARWRGTTARWFYCSDNRDPRSLRDFWASSTWTSAGQPQSYKDIWSEHCACHNFTPVGKFGHNSGVSRGHPTSPGIVLALHGRWSLPYSLPREYSLNHIRVDPSTTEGIFLKPNPIILYGPKP